MCAPRRGFFGFLVKNPPLALKPFVGSGKTLHLGPSLVIRRILTRCFPAKTETKQMRKHSKQIKRLQTKIISTFIRAGRSSAEVGRTSRYSARPTLIRHTRPHACAGSDIPIYVVYGRCRIVISHSYVGAHLSVRQSCDCSSQLRRVCAHMRPRKYSGKFRGHMCARGVYTCVCTPQNPGLACQTPKMAKMAKYTKTRFAAANRVFVYLAILAFWPNPELGAGPRTCARPARQKKMLATSCARARACAQLAARKKKKIFFFFLFFLVCTRARACAHC